MADDVPVSWRRVLIIFVISFLQSHIRLFTVQSLKKCLSYPEGAAVAAKAATITSATGKAGKAGVAADRLSSLVSSAASFIGQLPGEDCRVLLVHPPIVAVYPVQHCADVVLVGLQCIETPVVVTCLLDATSPHWHTQCLASSLSIMAQACLHSTANKLCGNAGCSF